MKYQSSKFVGTKQESGKYIIFNTQNSADVAIDCKFEKYAELLMRGADDCEIINVFSKEQNVTMSEAKRQVNSLLYALLSQNMIFAQNKTQVDGKTINIRSVLIEITDTCNFRCPHCYVNKTHTNRLTYADMVDICQELKSLKCSRVALTGGELLTNPEFLRIYNLFYDAGFIVSVNTNLSLLSDEILQNFNHKPPYEIEVSLYGYDAATFDDFTKTKGQFDVVVSNLYQLKENGHNVSLKNVVTNDNYEFFDKIEKKAKELGFRFRSDYISFPKVCDKFGENSQQISAQKAIEHLKKHAGAKEYFQNLFKKPNIENGKVFKCRIDNDTFFINSKKEVSMCVCMQSVTYPYKKGTLAQIIIEMQKIKELDFSPNAKCKGCKYLPLCRYCPGKFYMATASYEEPPAWFCEFGKLAYKEFIEK